MKAKDKKPNPERPDEDNPELTRDELRRARPAAEVLPTLIGERATQQLLRRARGRPPKEDRKVNQTLRIDPDVLEAYKQEGKGWQTRINKVLRENMPKRG
jgi:uncharacterized protein (DUF4415 family)